MNLLKYFLAVIVAAVICVFAAQWYYTGRISITSAIRSIKSHISLEMYYMNKHKMFKSEPTNEGCIVFLGDSLTDFLNLDELLPGMNVINRGIGGDTTKGVLQRLDEVIRHKPAKLFLLIGTNDIAYEVSPEKITDNIRRIITRIKEGSPGTKIYLQTLLPTNSAFNTNSTNRPNEKINAVNKNLRPLAAETGCELVDLNALLSENGELPRRYTSDGLHINVEAQRKWIEHIKPLL